MRYPSVAILVLLPLATLSTAAGATKECKLQRYAELPVTISGKMPLVAGTINGVNTRFLIDSGAPYGVLTREAVDKFALKLVPAPAGFQSGGTSGKTEAKLAYVKDFSLAGYGSQVLHKVEFVVPKDFQMPPDVAGIIGQNAIGHADTEYDLANGYIRLFQSKDCENRPLAYWAGSAQVATVNLELRTIQSGHLIGTATLNGTKIRVVFDTGAGASVLTRQAAERAGVELDDEGVTAAGVGGGIGKRRHDVSSARFDSFDLGGETIRNARLLIGDVRLGRADMLLGMDFFLSHRVYVASRQDKVYFTFNGGTVFDIGANPATRTAGAGAGSDADQNMSAGDYQRRGAAFAGKRDFASAIADFDQAVKLGSADPDVYYQRAMARRQLRQGALAIGDLDQTLSMKPDHVLALLERGAMRLIANNADGARTDFDHAIAAEASDPGVRLRVVEIYINARRYEDAIGQLDIWIAANSKDNLLAQALNRRCWVRTLLGKEMDLALADCNAALKKGSDHSEFFANRGVVWLRQGNFDKSIDDFEAALKRQPKSALSLYGLGVAERRKGKQGAGDKNIQAAIGIEPSIAELYRRIGLAP